MRTVDFDISKERLAGLKTRFPAKGKNSDIGKIAVEIVRDYFFSVNEATVFKDCKNGGDVTTCIEEIETHYETKGTERSDISFSKLKVSGWHCHGPLVAGMELVRVINIGNTKMQIHFMKYSQDFLLQPEPRWSVRKIKKLNLDKDV